MTYIRYDVPRLFKKIKDYMHIDNFHILPFFFSLYIWLIHEGESGTKKKVLKLLSSVRYYKLISLIDADSIKIGRLIQCSKYIKAF